MSSKRGRTSRGALPCGYVGVLPCEERRVLTDEVGEFQVAGGTVAVGLQAVQPLLDLLKMEEEEEEEEEEGGVSEGGGIEKEWGI